jgi:cytosine/adenosine deaminase-related metal-dependent hydrolase
VEENRRFLSGPRRGLTRGMVGAHASFTLSEETLEACVGAARGTDTGIHIHVAEDLADQHDCELRFGEPVVHRLARAGVLLDAALLAHCVYLSPEEVALLRGSGATVVHNARSNMNNAVGRALIQVLGALVALGTDGIGSDLFAESQAAHWREREENVFATPADTLARLARGSAFAGGTFGEPELGRIEGGAPADIVVLDAAVPTPVTDASFGGNWMFGLSSARVRDVVVAGEIVVRDRRTTKVDQVEVTAKAPAVASRLWERMEEIGPHPFEPRGG